MQELHLTQEWDKVFPKSNQVDHKKVTFTNHFGITLAADQYTPKNYTGKLPTLAVAGPFGAVKEQSSGLYAQTMAEKGYLTIAFDPSFTGESGGNVRDVFSLDINTEDFQAAVDYLTNLDNVDLEKVGIIGICGWGLSMLLAITALAIVVVCTTKAIIMNLMAQDVVIATSCVFPKMGRMR
ncbi:alpha/beta hydrolase [Lactobacillus kefiranofaciens]|nr:alpha/beta hydrolase [Lactobacillus kefiranofaciens]